MTRVLQVITVDGSESQESKSGKFALHKEHLREIFHNDATRNLPVCVVSVAGEWRQDCSTSS